MILPTRRRNSFTVGNNTWTINEKIGATKFSASDIFKRVGLDENDATDGKTIVEALNRMGFSFNPGVLSLDGDGGAAIVFDVLAHGEAISENELQGLIDDRIIFETDDGMWTFNPVEVNDRFRNTVLEDRGLIPPSWSNRVDGILTLIEGGGELAFGYAEEAAGLAAGTDDWIQRGEINVHDGIEDIEAGAVQALTGDDPETVKTLVRRGEALGNFIKDIVTGSNDGDIPPILEDLQDPLMQVFEGGREELEAHAVAFGYDPAIHLNLENFLGTDIGREIRVDYALDIARPDFLTNPVSLYDEFQVRVFATHLSWEVRGNLSFRLIH